MNDDTVLPPAWRAVQAYLILVALCEAFLFAQSVSEMTRADSESLVVASANIAFAGTAVFLSYGVVAKRKAGSKLPIVILLGSITLFDLLLWVFDGTQTIRLWRTSFWILNLLACCALFFAPSIDQLPDNARVR